MTINGKWWEGTKDLFALDRESRCKFMILLRGPFERREIANLLGVKPSTIYGWERGGQTPRLDHLRAMLKHFADWYVRDGLPSTLSAALAEITQKKDLTSGKKPAKKAATYTESEA